MQPNELAIFFVNSNAVFDEDYTNQLRAPLPNACDSVSLGLIEVMKRGTYVSKRFSGVCQISRPTFSQVCTPARRRHKSLGHGASDPTKQTYSHLSQSCIYRPCLL